MYIYTTHPPHTHTQRAYVSTCIYVWTRPYDTLTRYRFKHAYTTLNMLKTNGTRRGVEFYSDVLCTARRDQLRLIIMRVKARTL